MKRRLSVAISNIGDPRIIFMDEPTTGMDPISRAKVWKLIQRLKRKRVVILTTHSMQEADFLSDRIAVIAEGRFWCIGTSLFLKNNFGDGYKLNLVCDPLNCSIVEKRVKNLVPKAVLRHSNAGSMTFTVDEIDQLTPFFKLINF